MSELQTQSVKRGPGRPSAVKTASSEIKLEKGRPSWKPAAVLDVTDKEDGYRYRWSSKNPENLARKGSEGWETVSGVNGEGAKLVPSGRMNDGSNLTSIQEKHDCVLQRIPEEIAQERDAYFDQENARRISGLTSHIKKDIKNAGGEAHGEIIVSSREGIKTYE